MPERSVTPGAIERSASERLRVAFEERYLPLLRLGVLLTGRREMAEDMVQEAFSQVAPRIGALAPEDVAPYLRRVVINVWKNQRRRLSLERRPHAHFAEPAPRSLEIDDAIWQRVLRLPSRQRACIVLRYYEDLPEREVARLLRVTIGTVKSQTSRALAKLRKEFGDEA